MSAVATAMGVTLRGVGDVVKAGAPLAKIGNTGPSLGPTCILACPTNPTSPPLQRQRSCRAKIEATAISPLFTVAGGSRHSVTPSLPSASPAAGIPAGDPRIGSGSKCDAVRHYALLSLLPSTKVIAITSFSQTFNAGPIPNPIGTKKRHNVRGELRREREGRRLPKATCTGIRHSQRPKPALAAVRDWRSAGTGPPIRFNRRLDRDGSVRSRRQ
jgi:hypothetical protein